MTIPYRNLLPLTVNRVYNKAGGLFNMKLDVWMANTNEDEKIATRKYLLSKGADDLRETKEDGLNNFYFTMYCDEDSDILEVLAVTMYYNDRDPSEIETVLNQVRSLLDSVAPRRG